MVSRLFTKGASGVAKKLLKPKPKPKPKPKATGTGLSKPTVVKNKNKRKYEDNVAEMGGGRRVGSDAARRKAMTGKELQDAWQGLSKKAKNAERVKGKDSEFYSIIKKLSPTRKRKPLTGPNTPETPIDTRNFGDVRGAGSLLKAGGKVMKREAGGKVRDTKNATPKNKPSIPDSTKYGRGATRGADDAKMVPAKKMGGGQVMKYKKGGMVYKKGGGVIKASDGDSFVAGCYTNKSIA